MADVNTSVVLVITDDKLKAFITIRDETMLDQKVLTDLIQEREIQFGIDRETLDDLLKNPRIGTFIIAQGRPPKEGEDGYMQYFFTSKAVKQDKADQSVDFREIFNVPSVNTNTILAIYHPAVPGEDGITVTGQPIPARAVIELNLRAGKGATLSSDGMSVSSTTNGRPWVRKQGRNVTLGVDSIYNHEGDV
ncbi:MAG: FapA family protein, partial [Firmicutes bacterium]|nr:FapA family protein [Bacillota bacterium]